LIFVDGLKGAATDRVSVIRTGFVRSQSDNSTVVFSGFSLILSGQLPLELIMFDYLVLCLLALYAIYNYSKLRARRMVGDMPGPYQWLTPDSALMLGCSKFFPPTIPLLNLPLLPFRFDPDYKYVSRTFFAKFNSDIVSVRSLTTQFVLVRDPDAVKQIVSSHKLYPKGLRIWKATDVFGPHIASTEGSMWRLHRRIASPTFSERNTLLVHEQTVKYCLEMFSEWEQLRRVNQDSGPVVVDVHGASTKLALHIISAAGFGMDIPWADGDQIPEGHKLSFGYVLTMSTLKLFERYAFPEFIRRSVPIEYFKDMDLIYQELDLYLEEVLRKAYDQAQNPLVEKADLIYSLVLAALQEGHDSSSLTRLQLKSDAFAFLVAGMIHIP
jgi:cytochrome P450